MNAGQSWPAKPEVGSPDPTQALPAHGEAQPPSRSVAPPPTQSTRTEEERASHAELSIADATQTTIAAPRATVAPAAAATAAAVPLAPGGPGPVEKADDESGDMRDWRARRHRGLARLRIGQHVASDEDLERLQMTTTSFGLSMGRDEEGLPATLTLFRPEPSLVVLVGGTWMAGILAVRSLKFGARVVALTTESSHWGRVGRRSTGREDRVAVVAPGSEVRTTPSADAPVLRLYDADAPCPTTPTDLMAWETGLTLLRQTTPERMAILRGADIVLIQRLAPYEAATVASALGFTRQTWQATQALRDDMVVALTGTRGRRLWVDPSEAELELLGAPGRY